MKFDPNNVKVKAEPPPVALTGEREARAGTGLFTISLILKIMASGQGDVSGKVPHVPAEKPLWTWKAFAVGKLVEVVYPVT